LNSAPLEVTDAAGNLCWSGQYDTFGKLQGQTVAGAAKRQGAQYQQPLRYAGQYQDDESGLHYNLFRYYEPEVGRFTTQDPIGLEGGLNLYAYVMNPLTWVDPLGLAGCQSVNAKHIFHGEINRRGRAVGFHHEGSIGHLGKARVTQVTTPPNAHGVYKGKVEIFDSTSGQWVQKGPESTFFPTSWNRQKVMSEVRGAYNNGTVMPNGKWEGISPSGVKIGGYLDSGGNINTAFPIM
ncbi:EndoU domain-containing protein, partial [Serratia marcescens]